MATLGERSVRSTRQLRWSSRWRIDAEAAREGLQHRFAVYDKGGEEHYNLISPCTKLCGEATQTARSIGSPA